MKRNPVFMEKARFNNPRAELMRLRALYSDAALRGALKISGKGGLKAMRMLVGPDSAYHLYRDVHLRNRE